MRVSLVWVKKANELSNGGCESSVDRTPQSLSMTNDESLRSP